VRFLVDAQLPPALARALSERGYVAEHVADVGLLSATDAEIVRYAIQHAAVLITKDEDFPDLISLGRQAPAVVWVRLGNTTRRALLARFDQDFDRLVELIGAGEQLIELR
jgi:predicted nuclease of predicted toxin-antitoxin system